MLAFLVSATNEIKPSDTNDLHYIIEYYARMSPRSIKAYCDDDDQKTKNAFSESNQAITACLGTNGMTNDHAESMKHLDEVQESTTQQSSFLKLTQDLDLTRHLCLPILASEIFISYESTHIPALASGYFLVDCRPAKQYNAGHLAQAFHLDSILMLKEPSDFALHVNGLLEVQKQMTTTDHMRKHLCFIGSGFEKHDCYVNMVVASFLQKGLDHVSIVHGGFDAIHRYLYQNETLFNKLVVDHNKEVCKTCKATAPKRTPAPSPLMSSLPPSLSSVKTNVQQMKQAIKLKRPT